ncbi:MAG: S1/P1 nuclease [Paludibacteraceae bacterium]
MKKQLLVINILVCFASNIFAFDATGHRTIADIAYQNISTNTQKQIDNLLGKHGIIYFATWADDMRNDSTYAYSYNWHFQNLADNMTVPGFYNTYGIIRSHKANICSLLFRK